MLQALCQHLSKQLIAGDIIKEEEKAIYDYGIYLILMTLTSMSTIIILGIIWGKLELTVLFLLIISSIRHYTGGYHAKKYWTCYFLSCITYGVVLYLASYKILLGTIYLPILVVSATLYSLGVGSLNSEKNPKTEEEMLFRKKRARFTMGIYGIAVGLGISFRFWEVSVWLVIAWSQVVVAISLFVTNIQRGNLKWRSKKQY